MTIPKICRDVRDARKRAGITQTELARRIGLTNVAVNYIENGKRMPSTKTARKLADELDLRFIYRLLRKR